MNTHFIFGYGSLINRISRAATGQTGQAWPARITGYERHWAVMNNTLGMSSVAVIPSIDAQCNGLVIAIPEPELSAFDEREQGYRRSLVPTSTLHSLSEKALPDGNIWIYHADTIDVPNAECPIVLSYVDVIMAGCYMISAEFADAFIRSTQGWDAPTLNDRCEPRYPRAQTDISSTSVNKLITDVVNLTPVALKSGY